MCWSPGRRPREGIIVPRVLVVDDDPMVCVAIEVCLTRKGFEVTVADGGEANARTRSLRFRRHADRRIHAAYARLRSIRMFHERRPDVPIIAMSGYAFANTERAPDFLRMTIELGAACCLRKPFTPDALLTSVNQCITTPKLPRATRNEVTTGNALAAYHPWNWPRYPSSSAASIGLDLKSRSDNATVDRALGILINLGYAPAAAPGRKRGAAFALTGDQEFARNTARPATRSCRRSRH